MADKAKDLSSGTLVESVSASATSLKVFVGNGSNATIEGVWPATPFYITVMPPAPDAGVPNSLDSEIMQVSAVGNDGNGNVVLTVSRAQRGTTAQAFTEGAIITNASYAEDAVLNSGVKSGVNNAQTELRDKDGNAIYPKVSDVESTELESIFERELRMLVPTGTAVGSNKNLNTVEFLKVGRYYCSANATVATLSNCPTSSAFMMEVFSPLSTTIDDETTDTWCYRLRIITTYEGKRYIQTCNTSGTAGVWTYHSWLLDTPRDGTLTIQLDGTNVNTFTANSSSNKTANIVPRKLNNRFTSRPSSANLTQNGDGALTFFNATASMTTGKPPSDGHIIQMDWDNAGGYDSQIALTNGNKPRLLARGQNAGTWGDWTEFTPVKRSSQGGVWSTFFWSGTRHTDGQETVYTRRGTELKINFGNGGTWCNICAGASGIRAVRQMWSGVFTAMNANYGAGGLAASSTIYTRYYGALVNGGSAGIGEVARGVEGNSSSWGRYFGDLAGTTGGNRTSADCSMTSYRIGSSNIWVMSGTIGSQNVGTGMDFECRCTAYDAQTVPTTYQRGAGTNVSSYWQMIEVLES